MNAPAASGSGLLSELRKVGTYTVCHEWYGGSGAGQESSRLRVVKSAIRFRTAKDKVQSTSLKSRIIQMSVIHGIMLLNGPVLCGAYVSFDVMKKRNTT